MSWPDLDLVPPGASEVHEFEFTGSTATFTLPVLPVGYIAMFLRGGRGSDPQNLRASAFAPATAGTWTVLVGGDASGSAGGYGGGGDGGSGIGGHGDGAGGGGGSFVFDPDGTMVGVAGGTGGAAGAPDPFTPGYPFQLADLSPIAAYSAWLSGQNFAIGAPGWFGGQGGNLNPDRTYGRPGTGEAETYEGWELTATVAPGFGGAYGFSSSLVAVDGVTIGRGGDGATLDGFDGPGGGGGGGGSTGGGGGGAVNWEAPFVGDDAATAIGWGIGPGGHGNGDDSMFSPAYSSGRRALEAAGVPILGTTVEAANGKVLVFYVEGEQPNRRGGWGFGLRFP